MADETLTSINVILDESGSMAPLAGDTIGGFNAFLARQKEAPGRATVTLTKFSTSARVVYTSVPLEHVGGLSPKTYTPGGGTALLDAIAQTLNAVAASVRDTAASARPAKVIFLIMTDGEENSSREFGKSAVREMIQKHRETDAWEFVFMGANVDAFAEAQALGISRGNVLQYGATPEGTRETYAAMSRAMSSYRGQGESRVSDYFSSESGDEKDPKKKLH